MRYRIETRMFARLAGTDEPTWHARRSDVRLKFNALELARDDARRIFPRDLYRARMPDRMDHNVQVIVTDRHRNCEVARYTRRVE